MLLVNQEIRMIAVIHTQVHMPLVNQEMKVVMMVVVQMSLFQLSLQLVSY